MEARDGTPDGESPVVQLDDFDSPMLCSEPLGPMQNTFKDQKAEETMWNEKVSDEVAAESTTVRFVGLQQPSYGRWRASFLAKNVNVGRSGNFSGYSGRKSFESDGKQWRMI